MHLQVGTEKRLLSDVLDSPERSAHCVKALEFLLQAPSDPADAVPPPSLREAFWPGGDLTAAGTPHTRVRPWKERGRLTEKGARSIDLPDHPCDPTGARADHRTDAGPASYPGEVLRGERPKRFFPRFLIVEKSGPAERPRLGRWSAPETSEKNRPSAKRAGQATAPTTAPHGVRKRPKSRRRFEGLEAGKAKVKLHTKTPWFSPETGGVCSEKT